MLPNSCNLAAGAEWTQIYAKMLLLSPLNFGKILNDVPTIDGGVITWYLSSPGRVQGEGKDAELNE